MRSFTYAALFAGAIAADTAVVFNPFVPFSALALQGTEKGVKTYVNVCPADNNGVTAIPSSGSATPTASIKSSASSVRSAGTVQLTPIASPPSTTAAARLRREVVPIDEGALCEPYTLKQGSETYEFHMTDPSPGQWTIDANCNWKGEMTAADITCTITQTGIFAEEATGVATETYPAKSVKLMEAIQTVPLSSAGSQPTASGSVAPSGSASVSSSVSGSAAPTASAGMGAAGPLPTGAMAYVGGAAGLLAAALAL